MLFQFQHSNTQTQPQLIPYMHAKNENKHFRIYKHSCVCVWYENAAIVAAVVDIAVFMYWCVCVFKCLCLHNNL